MLAAALAGALHASWRKWPDPVIDFGRELYLPWRLSQGAVLYRDLDSIYGPLSPYFNASVFALTGPGLMWLAAVNLVIYAVIVVLLYRAVRAGWGPLAAVAGTLVFILVFSFGQYVGVGNYNFATPYAHETTHGFLLVLVVVTLGASWLRRPGGGKAFAMGFCVGLTVLLKVEILFAAGVVALGIVARVAAVENRARQAVAFFAGLALPPLAAMLCFARVVPPGEAFAWANSAWLGLSAKAAGTHQVAMLGTPGNLVWIALAGGLSVAAAGGAAWVARRAPLAVCGVLALAGGGVALFLPWIEAGKVLPVWLGLAVFLLVRRSGSTEGANWRWLLVLAAGALLARMAFHPRIYHYGYFQASLAAVVAVATAVQLRPPGRCGYLVMLGVFLGVGVAQLNAISRHYFRLKTRGIAEGVDRFYGFPNAVVFEETRAALAAEPDGGSLVVAPEGVMLNYLLRRTSPLSNTAFHPRSVEKWEAMVTRLAAQPPEFVVFLTRDLREYGVARFGDAPEHGGAFTVWVKRNYRPVDRFGFDPLDPNLDGAVIYRRAR